MFNILVSNGERIAEKLDGSTMMIDFGVKFILKSVWGIEAYI